MNSVMENEIHSQGEVLEALINRFIVNYCVVMDIPLEIKKISIIASGSSYNAGLFGKYFFENISRVETSVDFASEFINNSLDNYSSDTLYVLISQSGNSYDTVEALNKIKKSGARVLSVTNNSNSTIHNLADYKFDIEAGEEKAIAATKTFSATVLMLWIIAIKIAQNKQLDVSDETKSIYSIKQNIEYSLENTVNMDIAAKFLSKQKDFSIAGLGYYYPLGKEAALKIKETSYINTLAYPMGEFVHGHFAVLNKSKVLLTFLTSDVKENELKLYDKIYSTYHPKIVLITDEYEDYNSDILVKFEKAQTKIVSIINMIIIVQLLALKIAKMLKRDVDRPLGLVKVVENKGE